MTLHLGSAVLRINAKFYSCCELTFESRIYDGTIENFSSDVCDICQSKKGTRTAIYIVKRTCLKLFKIHLLHAYPLISNQF